jgi:DNA-binding NtrC family response regulator
LTPPGGRLLIVDDKRTMLDLLQRILSQQHTVDTAHDGAQALGLIAQQVYDVVLTDVRMPGADGLQILKAAKDRSSTTEVIVMTAFASIDSAVQAMRLGAYDYLQKPFDPDDVVLIVARALERKLRQPGEAPPSLSYRDAVNQARDNVSREYLAVLLRAFDGNVTRAAQHARLERESLHRLLKKYGLRAESFRTSATDDDAPAD